jgi:thiol-disulfide isomerase/thioredoxin
LIAYIDNLGFIKKEKLPVIVWFTVPGCPPCRAIEPRVEEFMEKHGDEFKIFRFDITKDPTVPQEWDVTSTPTFIYLFEGDEIGRLDGFPEVKDFEETLKTAKEVTKVEGAKA